MDRWMLHVSPMTHVNYADFIDLELSIIMLSNNLFVHIIITMLQLNFHVGVHQNQSIRRWHAWLPDQTQSSLPARTPDCFVVSAYPPDRESPSN